VNLRDDDRNCRQTAIALSLSDVAIAAVMAKPKYITAARRFARRGNCAVKSYE
jgi:hypothetical protein